MEIIFSFLDRFIFPEYTLAVIVLAEALKRLTRKIIEPKFATLIIGALIAIIGMFTGYLDVNGVNLMRLITSFALANMLYTYVIRLIMDRFSPKNQDDPGE